MTRKQQVYTAVLEKPAPHEGADKIADGSTPGNVRNRCHAWMVQALSRVVERNRYLYRVEPGRVKAERSK